MIQIEHFSQGIVIGEKRLFLGNLPELAVEPFNRVNPEFCVNIRCEQSDLSGTAGGQTDCRRVNNITLAGMDVKGGEAVYLRILKTV